MTESGLDLKGRARRKTPGGWWEFDLWHSLDVISHMTCLEGFQHYSLDQQKKIPLSIKRASVNRVLVLHRFWSRLLPEQNIPVLLLFCFTFHPNPFAQLLPSPPPEEENRAVPAGRRVNVFYGFLLQRSGGTRDPTAGNFSRARPEKTIRFLVFWPHVEPAALLLLGIMVWRLPARCPAVQGGACKSAVTSACLVQSCFFVRGNPKRVSSLTFDLFPPPSQRRQGWVPTRSRLRWATSMKPLRSWRMKSWRVSWHKTKIQAAKIRRFDQWGGEATVAVEWDESPDTQEVNDLPLFFYHDVGFMINIHTNNVATMLQQYCNNAVTMLHEIL